MAGRLPPLLRQLRGWLDAEQHADRLRSDDTTDPARIVDLAAAQLALASHAAHDLRRALDDAHQLLAHLGAPPTPTAPTTRAVKRVARKRRHRLAR